MIRINILILLTNYLSLKLRTNGNIERRRALLWTVRVTTFRLRSHKDHFAFFTALPQWSDQKLRMKCYLILHKLHGTRKIILKIILSPFKIGPYTYWCKFYLIISKDIISKAWTKQNKKLIFLRKLSSLDHILYINFWSFQPSTTTVKRIALISLPPCISLYNREYTCPLFYFCVEGESVI